MSELPARGRIPEDLEEQVVVGMYDRGLLTFPVDGVVLTSGRRSPYYYNAQPSLSFNRVLDRSGQMSLERQRDFRRALISAYAAKFSSTELHIEQVFGKAQAGAAVAAVGAYEAGLSYLWERVDEPNRAYGRHQKIEGDYCVGEQVLLVDDVVTDGQSKAEGMQVLRNVGLDPVAVTLQFDREEGDVQALENLRLEVNAITSLSRATRYLLDNHRIYSHEVEALHAYHDNLRADGVGSTFHFWA